LTERFGAFVIIVLGETLTGVVSGLSGDPTNPKRLAVGLVGVLIGFGSWWTYFDFAGHRKPAAGPRATVAWLFAHLPLTAAIAAMGATITRLVEESGTARAPGPTGWLVGGGACVLLAATAWLLTTLQDWNDQSWLLRPLAGACLLAGAAALGVAALRPAPLVLVVLLVIVFAAPWTFAVVRRAGRPDRTDADQPAR
jgi:low temperature requirement protein LtrA